MSSINEAKLANVARKVMEGTMSRRDLFALTNPYRAYTAIAIMLATGYGLDKTYTVRDSLSDTLEELVLVGFDSEMEGFSVRQTGTGLRTTAASLGLYPKGRRGAFPITLTPSPTLFDLAEQYRGSPGVITFIGEVTRRVEAKQRRLQLGHEQQIKRTAGRLALTMIGQMDDLYGREGVELLQSYVAAHLARQEK